ncbi:MAG: methyltransferase domain-containing protein [Candidatus Thermoplasmatota archaeon]|nr:methyltransferase domain-containing protein [Candidatus Thermoplasmatota archaeon]
MIDLRFEIIEKYIKGKEVLDIGCVGDPKDLFSQEWSWFHDKIRGAAKQVVGIDVNKELIAELKDKGYNIHYGNAEDPNLSLGRKFDVVVAGELIEHLSNQGIFLENVKKHLRENGILIISTPNAREIAYPLKRLIKGSANEEMCIPAVRSHLGYHTLTTLTNLLRRHGFSVIEYKYVNLELTTFGGRVLNFITKFIKDFSNTIVVVAQLAKIQK